MLRGASFASRCRMHPDVSVPEEDAAEEDKDGEGQPEDGENDAHDAAHYDYETQAQEDAEHEMMHKPVKKWYAPRDLCSAGPRPQTLLTVPLCSLALSIQWMGGGTRCQRIRSCGNRILNSCYRSVNIDFINPMVGVGAPGAKGYDLAEIVSLTRGVIF